MSIFRDASPRKAGSELLAVLMEKRADRVPLLLAACLPPTAIFFMVAQDVHDRGQKPRNEITYFESWPATRSREESLSANVERQKRKDAMMASQREAYKALGRAAGMDVEKMEAEALEAKAKRKADQAVAIEKSLKAAAGATKDSGAAK
jgi:hypothetical protein